MEHNRQRKITAAVKRDGRVHSEEMAGREERGRRTPFSKTFDLGNRAHQFVLYPEEVHYQDAEGNWQEINNRLMRAKNAAGQRIFKNQGGKLNAEFAWVSGEAPLVSLRTQTGERLAWDLAGAQAVSGMPQAEENARTADEDERRRHPVGTHSALRYTEILPEVDVVLRLLGGSFKDEIVLKSDKAQAAFTLPLRAEGLRLEQEADGTVQGYAPEKEQPVFTLPPAFMKDANGEFGHVKTRLVQDETGARLHVEADRAFLAGAAYPVTIDPAVETTYHSSVMEDNFVTTLSPNTVQNYAQGRLRVCKNTSYGECRSFLKFTDLPYIGSMHTVTKAYLQMSLYTNQSTQAVPVHLKEVTEDWSSQTITWNNQPDTADYDADYVIVPANAAAGSTFVFDISNLVRKWYDGSNYGVMFERRISTTPNTVEFVSSDSVYNKPVVTINYVSNAGLEDYMAFESQSCGRAGTAHVNLNNGNLVISRPITRCTGSRMPVSIDAYYGERLNGECAWMGANWRLSCDETIYGNTIGGTKYYEYTQGDGTVHYFAPQGGSVYKDQSGLGLTMTVSPSEILIESKDGVQRHFEPDPNDIEMCSHILSMNDPNGNTVTFTYTNYKLTRITDGAGRATVLTYDGINLASIQAPGETTPVRFVYTDMGLAAITDADGHGSGYGYVSRTGEYGIPLNLLATAMDDDGRRLNFEYPQTRPFRVQSMKEVTWNYEQQITGNHRAYTYGDCMTTVRDMTVANGKRLIYQFNDWGNVVSVRDELGYASYANYNAMLPDNHPELVSKLQRSVPNLFVNHSFASDSGWGTNSNGGTGTFAYVNENAYRGARAMKVTKTNGEGNLHFMQTRTLKIGKTYTFSAYAYGEDGAYVNATVQMGDSWASGDSIKTDYEWVRPSLTFVATTTSVNLYFLVTGGPGTVWFASAQLEESPAASRYNLLQNGDLSENGSGVPSYWSANGANTGADGIVTGADALHPAYLSDNRMRLYGDPRVNKGFYQDVTVKGSQGDTFVVSGWAKGYSRPIRGESRRFCIRPAFRNASGSWVDGGYVSWNEEWTDWQFVTGAVAAPCAYTAVRFNVDYEKNLNYADFDGFALYKEEFGHTYGYDADGNVTSIRDLMKQSAYATYDDYNNMTGYRLPGQTERTALEYGGTAAEQKKRLLRRSTTPLGVVTAFEYDDKGNQTAAQTQYTYVDEGGMTGKMRTTTSYTADKNYVSSKTDARGKTVTYTTDLNKGTLTRVTDPNGQSVNYTYDAMKRVTGTSATVGSKVYKNEYAYENDQLRTVKHNTTDAAPDVTYSFDYDKLGNQTTVKVGAQTLSTNVYSATGDKLLERVEYGNGGKVNYTYDGFKRVQGVNYDAATTPRFTYAYGANGQVASVRDAELNRTVKTEYDGADRPETVTQYEHTGTSTGQAKHRAILAYDERGNQDFLKEEMPDGSLNVTFKLFDADNRVEGVMYNYYERDIGYEYDEYGRVITREHRMAPGYGGDGDQFLTSYIYQSAGDLDTTPLVSEVYQPGHWYEYTYDDVGNITSVNNNNFLTTYAYDALGQLTRANDAWEEYTWTYSYDQGGNLVSKTKYNYTTDALGAPLETISYAYGDANWKDKLTAYNGKAITYDAIGNPLAYDGWTYTWKAGRMLHSMVKSGTNAQFAYDHNGLRVKKTVNGETTDYTLMGKNIVHLKKGAEELHFYYDAQGKPGMIRYNGNYYYYLYNLQGDVIAIMDDYANEVAEYYYDTWGKQLGCYGTMSQTLGKLNPFRYRGYVYDEETGLYYLRSRYYNPEWGRFISSDDAIDITMPLFGANIYSYCINSPVMHTDSDGNLIWPGEIHRAVQYDVAARNPNIILEVNVQKAGTGLPGRIDIYNKITREAWEVKPATTSLARANAQLGSYVNGLIVDKRVSVRKARRGSCISSGYFEHFSLDGSMYAVTYWYEPDGVIKYSYMKKEEQRQEVTVPESVKAHSYQTQYSNANGAEIIGGLALLGLGAAIFLLTGNPMGLLMAF